jgi:hypothetical protein
VATQLPAPLGSEFMEPRRSVFGKLLLAARGPHRANLLQNDDFPLHQGHVRVGIKGT